MICRKSLHCMGLKISDVLIIYPHKALAIFRISSAVGLLPMPDFCELAIAQSEPAFGCGGACLSGIAASRGPCGWLKVDWFY